MSQDCMIINKCSTSARWNHIKLAEAEVMHRQSCILGIDTKEVMNM